LASGRTSKTSYPLAKARLLLGLQRGDHREAGTEVRELARLALTTETVIGVSMAVGLLRHEEAAWETARLRGLEVSEWVPVPEAERQQLWRAMYAAVPTRSLLASDPLTRVDVGVFQCAALREPLLVAHFLSPYLRRSLRERYSELDEELSRSQCRLRRARLNQQEPEEAGRFPVSTRALCPGGPWAFDPPCEVPEISLSWLPLVRLPLGALMILSTPHVDHFERYRTPVGSRP
jgi:hypothetical protein